MRAGRGGILTGLDDGDVASTFRRAIGLLDGNIRFDKNLRTKTIAGIVFASTSIVYPIEHNLGFVPTGFLVIDKDKYADFKRGAVEWTNKTIYVQCNTANTRATILVF